MEIKKTNNYGIFNTVLGNRNVYGRHVKNLLASLAQTNLLPANPIIVNEKMEIIDGQHRLEAAKRLNLPIYYVQINGAKLEQVQILQTSRNWGLKDFMDSWIARGNQEYKTLADFVDQYKMPISLAVVLTSGFSDTGGSLSRKFKAGSYKASSMTKAHQIAGYLTQLRPYCEKGVLIDSDFVLALADATKKVRFVDLLHKLDVWAKKIERQVSKRDYLRTLENVYNFRAREETRLF